METEKEKIYWIDSLKLLAALLVFSIHFLAMYAPDFLIHWEEGHVLYGISGKLAVGFFFLMSGYFAMYAKKENAWKYVLKRYLRLSVPIFIVEAAVLMFMLYCQIVGVEAWISLKTVNYKAFLFDIFFLQDKVIPTYWGNFILFAGPVIVILLRDGCNRIVSLSGKYATLKEGIPFFLAGLVFFLLSNERYTYAWYTVCMSGALLYLFLSEARNFGSWTKRILKTVALLIALCCVRTQETNVGYVLKGMVSLGIVVFVNFDKRIQKFLENKLCKSMSKYSFEIYLVHTPINLMMICYIFGFLKETGMRYRTTLGLTYLISLGCTILCSAGLHTVSRKTVKVIYDKWIGRTD